MFFHIPVNNFQTIRDDLCSEVQKLKKKERQEKEMMKFAIELGKQMRYYISICTDTRLTIVLPQPVITKYLLKKGSPTVYITKKNMSQLFFFGGVGWGVLCCNLQ